MTLLSEVEERAPAAVAGLPLTEAEVRSVLDVVLDPELDEPITDLGFVTSVAVSDAAVEVHLRLPTSFCSPSFAYLMASDSRDEITALLDRRGDPRSLLVELDDHHDSDRINAGLAADAGYRGTFGHEAEDSLDELRMIFRRKAHTAAAERCLSGLLRSDPDRTVETLGEARLGDLPAGHDRDALVRRRAALGPARRRRRRGPGRRRRACPRPTCRWPCAGRGPPGSRSTATPTSAAACWPPATRVPRPTRPPAPRRPSCR